LKTNILDRFIHQFREIFIYNHSSLEFRAKIYTLPIVANPQWGECEFNKLSNVVSLVYPEARIRQKILFLTVREYVDKVEAPNGLGIDELILDIDNMVRREKRFRKKINLEHVQTIASCTTERESRIFQERIYEFLRELKKEK
jgi:hypothetical protein